MASSSHWSASFRPAKRPDLGRLDTIGSYYCAGFFDETPELIAPDVVRGLSQFVVGSRGVNVSWDSGRLKLNEELKALGWSENSGYAISPLIDQDLANNWPRSGCGFDEWYFFQSLPSPLEIEAFCNWVATPIYEWEAVSYKWNLKEQLERLQPEIVVGESYSIFVIAKDPRVVEAFKGLAQESEK